MRKQYGDDKGEKVFYASENKKKGASRRGSKRYKKA